MTTEAAPACVVPWGQVTHRADRIAVIGSGPSLKGVTLDIPEGVVTITVNTAIELVPFPDFWFTLDTSIQNRKIMANPLPGTVYYAAVYEHYGSPTALPRHYRDPPEPGVTYLRRIHGKGAKAGKPGLSRDPTGVHAGNSGYGAFNLAYLMGARRIALLGIDGQGGYANRPGSPRGGLYHIPWLFGTAKQQLHDAGVRVIVGSPNSKVRSWTRVQPQEALEWLTQ
jgi:hypothetical protein